MPNTVLVGAQWGDEGKGKITDLIASKYDYVVRYQGGNNAGHTVIHGDKKLALHLMPSGVMYENAIPVIGNGVVVDPGVLVKEMAMLEAEGISCKNLKISCDAHVIMPYHKDLDGADEKSLGEHKIGTTKRGIGPCYQDKVARKGIRIQDLMDEKIFRLKVETALVQKNAILEKIYGLHTYTVEEICEEYLPYARILKQYMAETSQMLNDAVRAGKSILFEGAQGTLLDIDHGTYPYVTSSSCCAGGAATGSGVGPVNIDRVLGIQKAYITRVGGGPFPTELKYAEDGGEGIEAEEGETLCQVGHEYGVTTGRKRRCGWFDASATIISPCSKACCSTPSPSTRSCRAGRARTSPDAVRSTSCRKTPSPTWNTSSAPSACRSASWPLAPIATKPSCAAGRAKPCLSASA